jgi:hypothetical protein
LKGNVPFGECQHQGLEKQVELSVLLKDKEKQNVMRPRLELGSSHYTSYLPKYYSSEGEFMT